MVAVLLPGMISKIIITSAGVLLMTFVYWFFLMKRDKQVIALGTITVVVSGGFSPSAIVLPKDKKTIIQFVRTDESACLEEVVIPDFKIRNYLPLHQPVAIELTPKQSGEFPFSCGMQMYHGKIIVK